MTVRMSSEMMRLVILLTCYSRDGFYQWVESYVKPNPICDHNGYLILSDRKVENKPKIYLMISKMSRINLLVVLSLILPELSHWQRGGIGHI